MLRTAEENKNWNEVNICILMWSLSGPELTVRLRKVEKDKRKRLRKINVEDFVRATS